MENENHTLMILTPNDVSLKVKFLDEVLNQLESTYKNVSGGCVESRMSLMEPGTHWRLNFSLLTEELLCCTFWREHKFGKKIFSIGHNGTPCGKYISKIERVRLLSLKEEHYFSESSDKIEPLLIREGFVPLSNEIAEKVLHNKRIQKEVDGVHYMRTIGNGPKRKIMFGNPKIV